MKSLLVSTMASLIWMRCFMCSTFLLTSFHCREADGNASMPASVVECTNDCYCIDKNGKIYNLRPLQGPKGNPRFPDAKLTPNGKWKFAYNPCTSFTLGSWGDCHHDVAICMWTQSSYENIGKQSTAKFVLRKNGKVHIEYKNERKYPTWTNKVYLICDPNKTNIEPTNFKVKSINDGRNNRVAQRKKLHYP